MNFRVSIELFSRELNFSRLEFRIGILIKPRPAKSLNFLQ